MHHIPEENVPVRTLVRKDKYINIIQSLFLQMEIVSFLSRVAGWSDDGINITSELLNEIIAYAATTEQATQAMSKVLKSAGNVLKSVQR